MRFRRDVLVPANAEVGTLAEPETEELEFATDPSECVLSFFLFFPTSPLPRVHLLRLSIRVCPIRPCFNLNFFVILL